MGLGDVGFNDRSGSSTWRGPKKTSDGKSSPDACIGRSRGGLTTKGHTLVDALGNPIRSVLSAGQEADITYAKALVEKLLPKAVTPQIRLMIVMPS